MDVTLQFSADHKFRKFAQIVVQKIIASQVVESNILKKFLTIKRKMVREQKLIHVKMLKRPNWTENTFNFTTLLNDKDMSHLTNFMI